MERILNVKKNENHESVLNIRDNGEKKKKKIGPLMKMLLNIRL